jgi:negative regulator of sigma E activity
MKDRIQEHHGLQLSALMDGELAPDQARFLLRRLEHDHELAGSWDRWHVAGDVLRGRAVATLPQDFPARIGTALAGERTALANGARRAPAWLRWSGGAALAASVAAVALLAGRPAVAPHPGTEPVAAAVDPPAVRSDAPVAGPIAVPDAPVAIAASQPERSPAAIARAATGATRDRAGRPQLPPAVAVAPVEAQTAPRNPFGGDIVTRPWPRAVLPQLGGGVLATGADAGTMQPAPSFYPFDPRRAPSVEAGTQSPGMEPHPPGVDPEPDPETPRRP